MRAARVDLLSFILEHEIPILLNVRSSQASRFTLSMTLITLLTRCQAHDATMPPDHALRAIFKFFVKSGMNQSHYTSSCASPIDKVVARCRGDVQQLQIRTQQ